MSALRLPKLVFICFTDVRKDCENKFYKSCVDLGKREIGPNGYTRPGDRLYTGFHGVHSLVNSRCPLKATDPAKWLANVEEFTQDETGKAFYEFIDAWTGEAERLLEDPNRDHVADALREALATVEGQMGQIHTYFLGQMLLVIITYWDYSEELDGQLTPIEMKIVQEALIPKIEELQKQAEQ